MDLIQKSTEEAKRVVVSQYVFNEIESLQIGEEIYDALDHIEFSEEDVVMNLAFRVESDRFFVGDFYFESHSLVYMDDINEIDVDKFLDFINQKQYIKYGV